MWHLYDVISILSLILEHRLAVLQVLIIQAACVCVNLQRLIAGLSPLQVHQEVCVDWSTFNQAHTAAWEMDLANCMGALANLSEEHLIGKKVLFDYTSTLYGYALTEY